MCVSVRSALLAPVKRAQGSSRSARNLQLRRVNLARSFVRFTHTHTVRSIHSLLEFRWCKRLGALALSVLSTVCAVCALCAVSAHSLRSSVEFGRRRVQLAESTVASERTSERANERKERTNECFMCHKQASEQTQRQRTFQAAAAAVTTFEAKQQHNTQA